MSALLRLRAGPVDRGWSLRKGVCVYVCDQVLFSAWGKQAWLSLVKFLGKRKFFLQLYFVFTQFLLFLLSLEPLVSKLRSQGVEQSESCMVWGLTDSESNPGFAWLLLCALGQISNPLGLSLLCKTSINVFSFRQVLRIVDASWVLSVH